MLRRSMRRGGAAWLALPLALAALWFLGSAAVISAKAWLGQHLLERAWARTVEGDAEARPWPWADTWPVARLSVPAHDVDLIVLAGAQGNSLAWAPGHLTGTAPPGAPGLTVLGAHRDTHFRFLEYVRPGEAVTLATPDGEMHHYTVTEAQVVDANSARIAAPPGRSILALSTCYPFDAITPGGPLRYLVLAEPTFEHRI